MYKRQPFEFHRLIRETLSELPPTSDSRDLSDGRESLTWSNSLRGIPGATSANIEGFTN